MIYVSVRIVRQLENIRDCVRGCGVGWAYGRNWGNLAYPKGCPRWRLDFRNVCDLLCVYL